MEFKNIISLKIRFLKLTEVIDIQFANIYCILKTFEVSYFPKSTEFKELQLKNIYSIFFTTPFLLVFL